MANIAILGSGGWGTALAIMTYRYDHTVTLWSPFEDEINALEKNRENKLLPGNHIDKGIKLTTKLSCVSGADIIILAVPSFVLSDTLQRCASLIDSESIVVNVSKGIDEATLMRLSEVIRLALPENDNIVVLSGPSHAEEVARRIPTTVVAASEKIKAAEYIQEQLSNPDFRIYTNHDVIGVELGGALKNIIALATGVCDGLGLGDNTKAALMTRGLTEMARLGVEMGALKDTFAGLSGIGDLIVTCTSMHSRNRRCGILIGRGVPPEEAVRQIGMTVEGYHATKTAYRLSKKYHVEMPITEHCYTTLFEGEPPLEAIRSLMCRPSRHEGESFWKI